MVTQACADKPFRSSAIVHIAVPTTLWSRADRNIPAIRPNKTNVICLWVITPVLADSAAAALRSARAKAFSFLFVKVRL